MYGAAPRLTNAIDSIFEDKGAEEDAGGFAKTFPDIPCVSQILGGLSLQLGDTKECLNIPSGIGCSGKDTGRLVTWEFPLRTDSAS